MGKEIATRGQKVGAKISFNEQLTDIYKMCEMFYNNNKHTVEYAELCVIAEEELCMAIIDLLESRKTGPGGPRRHDNSEIVAECRRRVKNALKRFIYKEKRHKDKHDLKESFE